MISLIISGIVLVISLTSVMVSRHYYKEAKAIERRFMERRKEQSGSNSIRKEVEKGGSPPRYSA